MIWGSIDKTAVRALLTEVADMTRRFRRMRGLCEHCGLLVEFEALENAHGVLREEALEVAREVCRRGDRPESAPKLSPADADAWELEAARLESTGMSVDRAEQVALFSVAAKRVLP